MFVAATVRAFSHLLAALTCAHYSMAPYLVSFVHKLVNVIERVDGDFGQILDVGAEAGMLSHLEIGLVLGVEQVADLFVVNLNVGHFDAAGRAFVGDGVDAVEQLRACARSDAFVFAIAHLQLI